MENPNVQWNTGIIWNDQVDYLIKEEGLTQEEAEEQANNDSDIYDFEWESVIDYIGELLKEFNPDLKDYRVDVEGFGWRNVNGYKEFFTENPEEFLRQILPDCDCTWKLFVKEGVIEINNFHHDSPTGEWYYIKLIRACEVCGDNMSEGNDYPATLNGNPVCIYCFEEEAK